MTQLSRRSFFLAPVLMSSLAALGQASTSANGNNNQVVGTNNGIINQLNVTIGAKRGEMRGKTRTVHSLESPGMLGVLIPAHEAAPQNRCLPRAMPNAITVFFGGGATVCNELQSCDVIGDPKAAPENRRLLALDKLGTSLSLHALLFDREGKIIVAVENNKAHVNTLNAFEWKKPDEHTVVVTDQRNRQILYVRFLNPKMILVKGIFFNSQGKEIEVTGDSINVMPGHMELSGNCSVDSHGSTFTF